MAACLSTQKVEECQHFLTCLLNDEDVKTCPFTFNTSFGDTWTTSELEGEVIDVLFKFLRKKNCPVSLVAPLTSFVRKRFFHLDLTACEVVKEADEASDYNPAAVCNLLFETVKICCREVEQDLSKLALKEFQQPSHVTCHSIRNVRRKMEDEHSFYEDINTLFDLDEVTHGQSMYAVFDGHGGAEAAKYAASQLICKLKSCSQWLPDPANGLKDAIVKVDDDFVLRAGKYNIKSGCTAVVVLIQGLNLTVAWLGDSQVVLCKAGQPIQLMDIHKPDREDERERIEALGGCVMFINGWRVNGTLAVSRAIGDIEQKPYVTSQPDAEEYEMEGDEEFLILACDGLWDTVDPVEAVERVQQCIKDGVRNEAAQQLVKLAEDNLSLDNITVMIVYLDFNNANSPASGASELLPGASGTLPGAGEVLLEDNTS